MTTVTLNPAAAALLRQFECSAEQGPQGRLTIVDCDGDVRFNVTPDIHPLDLGTMFHLYRRRFDEGERAGVEANQRRVRCALGITDDMLAGVRE